MPPGPPAPYQAVAFEPGNNVMVIGFSFVKGPPEPGKSTFVKRPRRSPRYPYALIFCEPGHTSADTRPRTPGVRLPSCLLDFAAVATQNDPQGFFIVGVFIPSLNY